MIRILCVSKKENLKQMESVVKEILPSSDVYKEEKITVNDVKKCKPHIILLSSNQDNFDLVKQINQEEIKTIVIFVGDEKVEAYDAIKSWDDVRPAPLEKNLEAARAKGEVK